MYQWRLTPKQLEAINGILKNGNQVEIKIERGDVVIVEVRRTVRNITA